MESRDHIAGKQVVAELVEQVWRRGDLDALPRFWTADCVNHAAPPDQQRGHEALRVYHETFIAQFAGFAEMAIDIVQQVMEGAVVATRMRTRAVHEASGRPVSVDSVRFDRIEDGRIAEHWSIADLAGLMAQLQG